MIPWSLRRNNTSTQAGMDAGPNRQISHNVGPVTGTGILDKENKMIRYRVETMAAFGQGSQGGTYWTGRGVAFSNSPKKACADALTKARIDAGEGTAWVPILEITKITDRVTGVTTELY